MENKTKNTEKLEMSDRDYYLPLIQAESNKKGLYVSMALFDNEKLGVNEGDIVAIGTHDKIYFVTSGDQKWFYMYNNIKHM